MAVFLNRIILSCFTGAEWRVKWRIVEDVLVGTTLSQPMALPMCRRDGERRGGGRGGKRRRASSKQQQQQQRNRTEQQHHR
ncbi:hypothetical protein PUN28_019851 [Cardiocondyla obscurior]|uniref:Secreted protein n=1 Tax=Cardiocondyla obscurior TaxID=286306 RepID=A0AAW2EBW8_9HYME